MLRMTIFRNHESKIAFRRRVIHWQFDTDPLGEKVFNVKVGDLFNFWDDRLNRHEGEAIVAIDDDIDHAPILEWFITDPDIAFAGQHSVADIVYFIGYIAGKSKSLDLNKTRALYEMFDETPHLLESLCAGMSDGEGEYDLEVKFV